MKYNKMAKIYDNFIYDVDYGKILRFYEQIFKKHSLNPYKILELGCGTGNLTSLLKDYFVYAIDNSEEMLTVARNKTFSMNNIKYFEMDMRNLNFNKKFDAVISSLDSINYILKDEELLKIFERVYNVLESEGLFIFDINSYYKISSVMGNNIFTDEVENMLYIWQCSFDKNTNINNFSLVFFEKVKDELYERFDEEHEERAYEVDELTEILKRAGFKKIEIYSDYDLKPAEKNSERINIVAKKGEK